MDLPADQATSGVGPESNPTANDDLKSLPMTELMAQLGSSLNGLSEAEAKKRLAV